MVYVKLSFLQGYICVLCSVLYIEVSSYIIVLFDSVSAVECKVMHVELKYVGMDFMLVLVESKMRKIFFAYRKKFIIMRL